MTIPTFLLLSLATYRLTILITEDDCPYGVCRKFREYLSRKARKDEEVRKSEVHKGIQCPRCSSIWSACIVVTGYFGYQYTPEYLRGFLEAPVLIIALSMMAVLYGRAFPAK